MVTDILLSEELLIPLFTSVLVVLFSAVVTVIITADWGPFGMASLLLLTVFFMTNGFRYTL